MTHHYHYEMVRIEAMCYDPVVRIFRYPCPCGDLFEISVTDLLGGGRVAVCPTCSLTVEVIVECDITMFLSGVDEGTVPPAGGITA